MTMDRIMRALGYAVGLLLVICIVAALALGAVTLVRLLLVAVFS